jgi:hypothetical protein
MENEVPQAPPQVTPPVGHSPEWYKARKLFIIALVVWLVSLPLAAVVQVIVRASLGSSTGTESSVGDIITTIVNITSLLMGLFGFIGWIPVLILGISWSNKK